MNELAAAPLPARIAMLVLISALAVSVVTDLRRGLILNAVTVPSFAIVCGCALWLGGLPLLLEALLGALVCAAPLLFANVRGWMGAGDVKLLALAGLVAGAAAGWVFSLTILLYVAVAGGVQALLWIAAAKARGREAPRSVPYGVAIAAGTAWALIAGTPFF